MLQISVLDVDLVLETHPSLFSPAAPDRGTMAMLSVVPLEPGMRVLDLGCGYGIVGITAAKKCGDENVWMCDIDPLAVSVAGENTLRNGVPRTHVILSDNVTAVETSGFDLILSNPPYQSDFSIARRFIEKGFNRLAIGGKMFMVTKRKAWYRNKLVSIFGGVIIHEIDGYYVFEAEKRQQRYARKTPGRHPADH